MKKTKPQSKNKQKAAEKHEKQLEAAFHAFESYYEQQYGQDRW
jgi:hypothetical protein